MEFIMGLVTGIIITTLIVVFWPKEYQVASSEYFRLKERVAELEKKYGL